MKGDGELASSGIEEADVLNECFASAFTVARLPMPARTMSL